MGSELPRRRADATVHTPGNSLIDHHLKWIWDGAQEALGLHDELLVSGQTLNTTSYNALISAYTKAGSLPNVLETFQRMFDQARSSLPRTSLARP